jgi:uncharacterized protein
MTLMIIVLFCLSLLGGFLSGFLGVGGALVMIPLMLSVPPLLGAGDLGVKAVSGLSMVQVVFASLSGIVIHKRNACVSRFLLLYIGIPMGFFSLIGSYLSRYMADTLILLLFLIMTLTALIIFAFDRNTKDPGITFVRTKTSMPLSLLMGAVVGALSGIVGAGGGFILIPLMVTVLKVPLRLAVGSSLGIIFIAAIFGATGKILSLQVEIIYLLPVLAGSLLAAQFGARVSHRCQPRTIHTFLLVIIALSMIQVLLKLLGIL